MKLTIHKYKHLTDREFILPDTGLVVISGVNGSGKSTLLNALVWCLFGGTGLYQVTLDFKYGDSEFKIFRTSKPKRLEVTYKDITMLDDAGQSQINKIFSNYEGFEISNGIYQGASSSFPFISQSERIDRIHSICEVKDDSVEFEGKCSTKLKTLEKDKIRIQSIFESIKIDSGVEVETDMSKEEIMAEISSISSQIRTISESKRKEEIMKLIPEKSQTSDLIKKRQQLEYHRSLLDKFERFDLLLKEAEAKKLNIEEERKLAIAEQQRFILSDEIVLDLKEKIKLKKILNKRDEFIEELTPIIEQLDTEGDLIEQLTSIKENPSDGFTCKCGIRYKFKDKGIEEDETVSIAQSLLSKIDETILEHLGTEGFEFDIEDALDKLFKNDSSRKSIEDIKKRKSPQMDKLLGDLNKLKGEIEHLERPATTIKQIDIDMATITVSLKEEMKYDKLREEAMKIKTTLTETSDDLAESLDELTAMHRFVLKREKEESKITLLQIEKNIKIIKDTLKLLKDIRGERLELFNKHLGILVKDNISQLFSTDVEFVFETLTTEVKPTIKMRGGDLSLKDLSGGEQQRLNLAFASATRDILEIPVFILDESLSFVDDEHYQKSIDFLKKKSENCLILLVTHKETTSDLVVEL